MSTGTPAPGTAAGSRSTPGVTMERVEEVHEAFNTRAAHASPPASPRMPPSTWPRGRIPTAAPVHGREAIRALLAERFSLIPDMAWELHYGYTMGERAVTVWRVTGHAADGTVLDHQGCDLWEFSGHLVQRKDTVLEDRAPRGSVGTEQRLMARIAGEQRATASDGSSSKPQGFPPVPPTPSPCVSDKNLGHRTLPGRRRRRSGGWRSRRRSPWPPALSAGGEELEHTFSEQLGGIGTVGRQARVGEQVPIAG